MPDDLARAFEFIVRADMAGTRAEPFRWGTAVFMPECPLRHDSNYLLVDATAAPLEAAALAAEADRIQGAAGLEHRCILFRDARAGERMAGAMEKLGWTRFRGIVMAQRRAPDRDAASAVVVRTDAGRLQAARTAQILTYPWGTPEVARQLLEARAWIPVETRYYAVFVQGEPVSWAELYVEGDTAQIEAVATLEPHRSRGYASAIVLRAASDARRDGAEIVFLCTDAEDRPKDLYRRLGFDEIGRYVKFTRV